MKDFLLGVLSSPGFNPLVTFLAGVVGGVFGFIGASKTARRNEDIKFGELIYTSRLKAYQELLNAATDCERHYQDVDKLAVLCSAKNAAELLASSETSKQLSRFVERIKAGDFKSDQYRTARNNLLESMKADLFNVPKIKVRKSLFPFSKRRS